MGATPSLLRARVPASISLKGQKKVEWREMRAHTVESQGVHVVLLRQREDVLQGARHHDGLVRVGVECKTCERTAGLHSQGALVCADFACNFDENMNALVAGEVDEKMI
jgi:hypothetical protein